MTSTDRNSIPARARTRATQNRSPQPAAAVTPGPGAHQLAAGGLELRREEADRRAIERAEDEGMTLRPD